MKCSNCNGSKRHGEFACHCQYPIVVSKDTINEAIRALENWKQTLDGIRTINLKTYQIENLKETNKVLLKLWSYIPDIDSEPLKKHVNLCACVGPKNGDPFCPCEMRRIATTQL